MRKALSICAVIVTAMLAFSCSKEETGKSESIHEAVDLGLSVKWATCNVGATSPEGMGDYFAWGETETKTTYDWNSYKMCNYSDTTFTKYCPASKTQFWHNYSPGTNEPDNLCVLEKEDDVATVKWGGKWRIPTNEEWNELKDNCDFTWTTLNGVRGILVTRKQDIEGKYAGKSIFLPAAGDKFENAHYYNNEGISYWSSSLSDSPFCVWSIGAISNSATMDTYYRCYGRSVRPVSD